MKNIKKTLGIIFLFIFPFISNAQHRKVVGRPNGFFTGSSKVVKKNGDVSAFKKTRNINLEVDYSSLKVGEYTEDEYIKKKREDLVKKGGQDKADEWQKKWENAKANIWPKRFAGLYNEVMKKKKISSRLKVKDDKATKTLIVYVTYIEPGYHIFIDSRSAFANFEFKLVDNSGGASAIAELYANNVQGIHAGGDHFDVDRRVGESFDKAAKMLATYIIKKSK